MMTIFGLFESYEEAGAVVDELLEMGAELSELNVLVQSGAAKSNMEIDHGRAGVAVTDKVGEVELHGLDRLLAGEQVAPVLGLGGIYASGELANFIMTSAQERREEAPPMEVALREFGLSTKTAATYASGIASASWLIFVRTDGRKAKQLLPVLRKHTDAVTTVSG
jgi:hypothetical protein